MCVCVCVCVCVAGVGGGGWGGEEEEGLKLVLLGRNLALNSYEAPNYKYMFDLHSAHD